MARFLTLTKTDGSSLNLKEADIIKITDVNGSRTVVYVSNTGKQVAKVTDSLSTIETAAEFLISLTNATGEDVLLSAVRIKSIIEDADSNFRRLGNEGSYEGEEIVQETISQIQVKMNATGGADNAVISDPTGVTGADQVTNMISLTQAEYDAIASPDASTFYIITA